jgi:uncharacterized protein
MAKFITQKEKDADLFTVELAALLHDIADWKFHKGDDTVSSKVAEEWLKNLGIDQKTINHVSEIARHISFKGAKVKNEIQTKEGEIVQDADKLDAIGAIGIARTFATGSKFGRIIFDPDEKPVIHTTFKQYKKSASSSINHFYEKTSFIKGYDEYRNREKACHKKTRIHGKILKGIFPRMERGNID